MTDASAQSWNLLRASGYQRMRWKNGAGWSSEIVRFDDPISADDLPWLWRISIAELEHDGPFSTFPGVSRELVMLSGNGLNLYFEDGQTQQLKPFARLSFAGERAAHGALIDGPSRDFNLMWKRAQIDASLWQRRLEEGETLNVQPGGHWVLHVLSGHAQVPDAPELEALPGDTLYLQANAASDYTLRGEGEILLMCLRKR